MHRLAVALSIAVLLSIGLPANATAASVVQTWPVGVEPFGVTVDPRDGRVYVAISDHNNWYGTEYMWAIDPTVPLPWDPAALPRFQLPRAQVMSVLDPDLDRLFVSTNGGLAIVDVPTHALISNVALGATVGVSLDRSTHRVYAATLTGVALVDGASGSVLATRQATNSNDAWWMLAQDPLRHRVYVANGNYGGSPSLVVLDDADLSLIANIPLPAIPRLALSVDVARGLVYVGGFSSASAPFGSLYAIDETSLKIVKTLDVGQGAASPFSMTLVPETNRLYVSNISGAYSGNALVAVDTATFTVVDRLALPFQPGQSALHPDGRLYVAAFDTARLAAISFNLAPVIDGVTIVPPDPDTNAVLSAAVTAHDPDGDPVTLAYRWHRNGVLLTGETAATLDLSKPGNGDHYDTITVDVVVSDGTLTGAAASASVVIRNSVPTLVVTVSDATPSKHDVLIATAAGGDADNDALAYTYTWRVNGKLKQTTTATSATTSSFDLRAAEVEIGDQVTVDVVVSDGAATTAASASATVTPAGH